MTCLPQIERRLLLGGQFELKSGMFLSRRRYVLNQRQLCAARTALVCAGGEVGGGGEQLVLRGTEQKLL